jgi:hypothetical protein
LRGGIDLALLVSGRFRVSKTIILEAQEHLLVYPPCRDTPVIGGFGLMLTPTVSDDPKWR